MTTLALSMIVRDAAALLPGCLQSARGVVDEIFVADTGSTDNTMDVATRLGAQVVSIPWTNHFADARNRALAEVRSDWVLSLDADEQLGLRTTEQIRPLLEERDVSGYLVTIRNYVLSLKERVWDCAAKPNDSLLQAAKKYPGFVEHQNVRLFRRDKAIYFVGRVHESVGPRILELGGRLEAAPFSIHHFGLAMDAETRARKNHFYRELGREKIREMPENAQARLELGIVEMDNFGNLPEALALFEQACKLDRKLGVAWFFRGLTLVKLESYSAALESLVQAEKQGHKTSLAAETQGDAEYNLKDYSRASQSYKIALQRSPGNASLESKLGLSLLRLGKTSEGMRKLQRALARNPAAGELHDRLILALVWLDLLAEAAEAAEVKLKMSDEVHARDFLRAASLWTQARNSEKTGEVLLAGLRRYPDHDLLLRALREAGLAPQTAEFTSSLKSGTSGG